MMNEARLKASIRAAFSEENEKSDAPGAMDRIAEKIAKAVIAEVKAIEITYISGLTSATGGPVTPSGPLKYTIQ
ncbi:MULTISPECIES: hypothetical protein [Chitinophaga]|uniref:Uncharacterized protein n=1 Tax=Chitinophaga flava TaxID=2259036 RepID=A0A365XQX0_9BACT|nr:MULTISPECIES: hypothetical protein [Chitinophaga]RBL88530.1 hypothetical protein DF182_18295 [Chitinophaga flava]